MNIGNTENIKNKQYPLLLTGTIDSRSFDGDGIDLKKD